jgi:hypothetical protein
MLLPLLERAKEQHPSFLLTHGTRAGSDSALQCGTSFAPEIERIPQRALLPGEQYLQFAKTLADFEINDIAALPPVF